MTYSFDTPASVTLSVVPLSRRMNFLPQMFGRHFMRGEASVYNMMTQSCPEYSGGLWVYADLSNGGRVMYPDMGVETVTFRVAGNGSENRMSPQAAGIATCLIVLSAFSIQLYMRQIDNSQISERFHQLRDYALDHPEQAAIFSAID